jgi:hypothetical protein
VQLLFLENSGTGSRLVKIVVMCGAASGTAAPGFSLVQRDAIRFDKSVCAAI